MLLLVTAIKTSCVHMYSSYCVCVCMCECAVLILILNEKLKGVQIPTTALLGPIIKIAVIFYFYSL